MNTYDRIYNLLCERTNPNTKAKAAAKAGKMAKKARSLMRKGGKVRGIDVSKEAMAHMSGRGEGSQSDEAPGVTAVRQLKLAAPRHKRGEVAVTSSHGAKTTGTELVKKRSEIPDKDVVKTSTTTKPERGEDVEVSKVHTSRPTSQYATNQGTSVVVPKNPAYMPPKGKTEKSRAYKKRTTGSTTLTTHPGRSAPPVSQWKQSGHVVVEPRKDEMNSFERLYSLLLEAHKLGGRFTPEDHDYEGRVGSKSAQKGTKRMKKQVSASPKGATIAIGREGNVPHPETEKEIGKHAKAQGKKVVTYGLEHPETDVYRAGDYSKKKPGTAVDRRLGREYGSRIRQAIYHAHQASHGGERKPTRKAGKTLKALGFDPGSQESMKQAGFPQDYGRDVTDKRRNPIGHGVERGMETRTIGHRHQEREQRRKGRTTVQKVGSGLFR